MSNDLHAGLWAVKSAIIGSTEYLIPESPSKEDISKWAGENGYALVPIEPSKEVAWKMILAAADVMGFHEDGSPTVDELSLGQKAAVAMIAAAQESKA